MQLTSAKSRRWASYNRHRAKFSALDRMRRIERAAQRADEFVEAHTPPKVRVPRIAAFATVTVCFRDGRKAVLKTYQTPFGLTTCPSAAGAWLTRELHYQQATT
jgi:hypothetical protein